MCMCDSYKNEKNNKGDEDMVVTTLKEIEQRVKRNSLNNENTINNFRKNLEKRNFKKGRVRPRDITEQRILDSFKRK